MSTQTETAPIDPHWTHSERLMQHAFEELAKGERIQASEKAWGAMAHTLKAIADERGLTYGTHSQALDVLYAILADVTDLPRQDLIVAGFYAAADLHRNFYNDVHLRDHLNRELEVISRAIGALGLEQSLWLERNAPAR